MPRTIPPINYARITNVTIDFTGDTVTAYYTVGNLSAGVYTDLPSMAQGSSVMVPRTGALKAAISAAIAVQEGLTVGTDRFLFT